MLKSPGDDKVSMLRQIDAGNGFCQPGEGKHADRVSHSSLQHAVDILGRHSQGASQLQLSPSHLITHSLVGNVV